MTERQLEIAIGVVIVLAGLVGLWLATIGGWVLVGLGALRDPRGARLHGRAVPVRVPGAGRGVRVRVLRAGGGRRDGVPPGAAARRRVPRGGDPAGPADHRDPRRQQPARHPDRRRGGQADARGGARQAADAGGVRRAAGDRVRGAGAARRGLGARGAAGRRPVGASGSWSRCRCSPLPLARPLLRTVATFGEPRELNLVLKGTARLSLVFGCCSRSGSPSAAGRE